MKLGYKIAAWLAVALGVAHLAFTFFYDRFTLNTLWFVGSGLTIIFAGFLNLALIRITPKDSFVRALCIIANLASTILFIVASLSVLQEPQVFVGIAIFVLLTVFSFLLKNE